MSHNCVFKWFSLFPEVREDISDDTTLSRRPKKRRHDRKFPQLVASNRRLTLKMMELDISRERTRTILEMDLGKKKGKVCSKFVPHNWAKKGVVWKYLATALQRRTVTRISWIQLWCFDVFGSTPKQKDSMEWRSKNPTEKFASNKSKVKTLLITFFYSEGMIYKESMLQGHRQWPLLQVYHEAFTEAHPSCKTEFDSVRRLASLLHDNIPAHSAVIVKVVFGRKKKRNISPYLPDLTRADLALYFLNASRLRNGCVLTTFNDM